MNYVRGETFFIDKPLGWTSFDAVKYVRGAIMRVTGLRRVKVGHAGTLDPLATGVMIVVTGRSTRTIEVLQSGIKEYVATIALGATTPSFDMETAVDATYPTLHITEELVRQTLPQFIGRIEQLPPAYSACKVAGQRAYEYARQGEDPGLKPKLLEINEIELLAYTPTSITIRVVCGKGTYIRALARDIGVALRTGAHLTGLRRTRVGDVTLEQCFSPQDVANLIANSSVEYPDDYPQPHKTLSESLK